MRDKEKCSAGCAQMRKEIICLRQIASGTQSCQAPQRLRGWGVEVGLPTLFCVDMMYNEMDILGRQQKI